VESAVLLAYISEPSYPQQNTPPMKILHHKSQIAFEFGGRLKIPVSKLSFYDLALMELRPYKKDDLEKHLKFILEDLKRPLCGNVNEKTQLIKAIEKVIKEKSRRSRRNKLT
jgi:hypothetical protein